MTGSSSAQYVYALASEEALDWQGFKLPRMMTMIPR